MTLATVLEDAAAEQNQFNRHAARTPAHLAIPFASKVPARRLHDNPLLQLSAEANKGNFFCSLLPGRGELHTSCRPLPKTASSGWVQVLMALISMHSPHAAVSRDSEWSDPCGKARS